MRNAASLAIVMIALGGLAVSGIGAQKAQGPIAYVIAGWLVVGGAGLFVRSTATFLLALSACLVTAITGVLALFGHPEWALPLPWWGSTFIGLYLCIRVGFVQYARQKKSAPETPTPSQ